MRQVLVLSPHYPPIAGAQSTRVAKLVKYLPGRGWRPTVVSATEDPSFGTDYSLMKDVPIEATVERAGVGRAGLGAVLSGIRVPDHIGAWIQPATKIAMRLIRSGGFDAIASFSFPPSAHLAALGICIGTGLPWFADFSDPWMNNPYSGKTRRWRRWLGARMESAVFQRASRVGFTNAEFRDYVSRFHPKVLKKAILIPNSAECAEFDSAEFKKREGAAFVVAHIGSLYGLREPGQLFHALSQFSQSHPNIVVKLQLIGTWKRTGLDDKCDLDAGGVEIEEVGRVPRVQALQYMCTADVLVLIDPSPFEPGIFLPTKLIEYIMSGRPILALSVPGPVKDLITQRLAGIVVHSDDVKGMVSALESLYADGTWIRGRHSQVLPEFESAAVSQKLADALTAISK